MADSNANPASSTAQQEPIVMPPDPDCRLCNGRGLMAFFGMETDYRCECTMVCDCGEERPNNFEVCASPGCNATGCDSCNRIEWCCSEHDEPDGDYFCDDCR